MEHCVIEHLPSPLFAKEGSPITMRTTRTQNLIAAALACARERNSYNRLPR